MHNLSIFSTPGHIRIQRPGDNRGAVCEKRAWCPPWAYSLITAAKPPLRAILMRSVVFLFTVVCSLR